MQAIDTERSPGLPSLMVTTRRRLMPHGTSCSFLQAVTQALHSMQRSASQRNFIRAIAASLCRSDLTERDLGLLHVGHRIVAIGRECVYAFAEHDRIGSGRILAALIDALEPTGKVEGQPGDPLAHALCHQRLHARLRVVLRAEYPDPLAILDAAVVRVRRIDLDEYVLLQLGQPFVGAGFLAAALVLDDTAGGEGDREL